MVRDAFGEPILGETRRRNTKTHTGGEVTARERDRLDGGMGLRNHEIAERRPGANQKQVTGDRPSQQPDNRLMMCFTILALLLTGTQRLWTRLREN